MYRQTKWKIYGRDKVWFRQDHQGHNLSVVIIKYMYTIKMKKGNTQDNRSDTYFIGEKMHYGTPF